MQRSIPYLVVLMSALTLPGLARAQDVQVDLAAADRPAAEKARDASSSPLQELEWIGLQPGWVVADMQAGGGYHTWIFSHAVGPDGFVYSQSSFKPESLRARIESGDLSGSNVAFVPRLSDLPDDSLNLVFTDRNYHDIPAEAVPQVLSVIRSKLKPGGLFVVIDAVAAEGRDVDSHRIAPDVVRSEVQTAGFELVDSSDMLANPDDDHVGPHWNERDQLDRFMLKFRKPAGDEGESNAQRPGR